jgi:hypothetical protein
MEAVSPLGTSVAQSEYKVAKEMLAAPTDGCCQLPTVSFWRCTIGIAGSVLLQNSQDTSAVNPIEYYIGFFTFRVPIELTLLGQRITGGQTVRKVPDWFNGGREGLRAREPSA